MSLTKIVVRNFQSLKAVDLDLGTFTVIVGPSSSGKSALIRAFRALASNVRGTNVITSGQKQMAITADLHPGIMVTLERGERASAYRLWDNGTEITFTKLAGDVPQQITQALRLDPGQDSINFAGQFDKPYLLDESGSTIARQLAELTNVNQIFEAVRAANRIRSAAQSTLRTRQADLATLKKDFEAFSRLREQLMAYEQVQTLAEDHAALRNRAGRLETAMRALRVTETALQRYKPRELPDSSALDDCVSRFRRFQKLAMEWAANQQRYAAASAALLGADTEVEKLQSAIAGKLTEAGVCPTCGQKTQASRRG